MGRSLNRAADERVGLKRPDELRLDTPTPPGSLTLATLPVKGRERGSVPNG